MFFRNGSKDRAGFGHRGYPPLILNCVIRNLYNSISKGHFPLGTLPQSFNLADFSACWPPVFDNMYFKFFFILKITVYVFFEMTYQKL